MLEVYVYFYVVCYKYLRVELEMFQLKRENPRNHSNLIQMDEPSSDFILHNSWDSTPENDDLFVSIIQGFNKTLEANGELGKILRTKI